MRLVSYKAARDAGIRAFRVLVAACVVLALTAGFAELIARLALRNVRSSGDARNYFATRQVAMRVNNVGFRGPDVGLKTVYRIVVIGDSITWGQGIEEGERFSNLIQDALGPGYEVLNFGRPGDNLPDHLNVLEEALPFSPDFILLQLYINDFETDTMTRPRAYRLLPWPGADAAMLRSSVVYTLLGLQWWRLQELLGLIDSYPQYMKRHLGDPGSPESRRTTGMLRQFVERAHAGGTETGTVLFAYTNDLGRGYPFSFLHERVREVCRGEAIHCVDLREPFAATFRQPQEMWVTRFDQHPNARANRRAAAEILREFGPLWHDRMRHVKEPAD